MENYFEKYKKAKLVLLSLIKENNNRLCDLENLEEFNLKYAGEYIYDDSKIRIYMHNYEPIANMAWNILSIEDSVITDTHIKTIKENIKNEQEEKNCNYETQYLKIYLIICKYVSDYYSSIINIRRANELGIRGRNEDLNNNQITLCSTYGLKGALDTWDFLEIDREEISSTVIEAKRDAAKKRLLKIDNINIDN